MSHKQRAGSVFRWSQERGLTSPCGSGVQGPVGFSEALTRCALEFLPGGRRALPLALPESSEIPRVLRGPAVFAQDGFKKGESFLSKPPFGSHFGRFFSFGKCIHFSSLCSPSSERDDIQPGRTNIFNVHFLFPCLPSPLSLPSYLPFILPSILSFLYKSSVRENKLFPSGP